MNKKKDLWELATQEGDGRKRLEEGRRGEEGWESGDFQGIWEEVKVQDLRIWTKVRVSAAGHHPCKCRDGLHPSHDLRIFRYTELPSPMSEHMNIQVLSGAKPRQTHLTFMSFDA